MAIKTRPQPNANNASETRLALDWWTDEHEAIANREGWCMVTCSLTNTVEFEQLDGAIDDAATKLGLKGKAKQKWIDSFDHLGNADDVLELLIEKALKGSRAHLLAMYLDGKPADEPIWVPPGLRNLGRKE